MDEIKNEVEKINDNDPIVPEETSVTNNEEVVEPTEQSTDETVVQDDVEPKIYTQKDIDDLQAQIDDLSQYKPKEKDESEIRLEKVWQREINATLKEEGLTDFAEFIRADVDDTATLNKQIAKLKEIVGAMELSNSYQPSNHKPADGYSIAKKNRDVQSMIKNKLS